MCAVIASPVSFNSIGHSLKQHLDIYKDHKSAGMRAAAAHWVRIIALEMQKPHGKRTGRVKGGLPATR